MYIPVHIPCFTNGWARHGREGASVETVGSVRKQVTQRVGFLLMDQFTLVSLSSAIDPLRVANLLSDTELYRWCLIGAGEGERVSSDGVRVKLDHTLSDDVGLDLVIVVGGIDIEESVRQPSGPLQFLTDVWTQHGGGNF